MTASEATGLRGPRRRARTCPTRSSPLRRGGLDCSHQWKPGLRVRDSGGPPLMSRFPLATALFASCVARLGADAPAAPPPTWAHDVAPILMGHCVECHRPGQVAPFPLLAYRDAAKRARFLAKTVVARVMPPWS